MRFKSAIFALAIAVPAHGAMDSVPNGSSVTFAVQDYTAAQKVLFNGVAGHKPHWRDYFGLFAAGSEVRLQWCYLDGTKVQDQTRLQTSGACTFSGLRPGKYAARVYAAGGMDLLDSTLFTVGPMEQEYRTVAQDGTVTIDRVAHNPTTDRATIKRSADFTVTTILLPKEATLKTVGVSYSGQVTATSAKGEAAKPARANP